MNAKKLIEELKAVQTTIENCACGGVGADGATQKELDECHKAGHSCEDNADYDTCQSAWREIERIIEKLTAAGRDRKEGE